MEKLYYKVKYIILEYEEILKLDKEYMSIFLQECMNELNIQDNNFVENEELIDEKDEKIIFKKTGNKDCKKLYKKLAKIFHPDKNQNNNKKEEENNEEFINISKAYENNDYIKLFMLCYENNIEIKLTKLDIELIENEIKLKENEIKNIKEKIHWKWIYCENEFEKEILKQQLNSMEI